MRLPTRHRGIPGPRPHSAVYSHPSKSSKPTISLTADFGTGTLVVDDNEGVTLTATAKHESVASALVIKDIDKNREATTCLLDNPCSVQVHHHANSVHTYRAYLVDGQSRKVEAHSSRVVVHWEPLKLDLAALSPDPNVGPENAVAGEEVHLQASALAIGSLWKRVVVADYDTGEHIVDCDATDLLSCYAKVRYYIDPAHPGDEVVHHFRAAAVDAHLNVLKLSDVVRVGWWPALVTINVAGRAQGAVTTVPSGTEVTLETSFSYYGKDRPYELRVVDTTENKIVCQHLSDSQAAGTCDRVPVTYSEGTHTFVARAYAGPGTDLLGESVAATVTWTASPCGPSTLRHGSVAEGPRAQSPPHICLLTDAQQVNAGTQVTLKAYPDTDLASGQTVTITNTMTGAVLTPSCAKDQASGVTECQSTESYPTSKRYTYVARIMSGSTEVARSSPLTIQWTKPWTVTLDVTPAVMAGTPAELSATVNQPLDNSGYSLVLTNTTTGKVFAPCTAGVGCLLKESSPNPGTWTYVAKVVQDATEAAHSDPKSATWWSIALAVKSGKEKVAAGTDTVLTATASFTTAGTPYKMVIRVLDNHQSNDCPAASSCDLIYHDPSPATHTFQAAIVDGYGDDIATSLEKPSVTWVAWTVSLTADATSVPVGTTVTLSATANFSLTGTGYSTVIVSDSGQQGTCTSDVVCTWPWSSSSPGSASFLAYIVDPSGHSVANSGSPLTLTWTGSSGGGTWTIVSFTASNTHPSGGATVTLTATANQTTANTNYIIKIAASDSTGNSIGYIYNECGDSDTCSVTMPYQSGPCSTGSGPCYFVAFVSTRATEMVVSNMAFLEVDWGALVRVEMRGASPSPAFRSEPADLAPTHRWKLR